MKFKKHGIDQATDVFNKNYTIEDRGYKTKCWIVKSPDKSRGGYGRIWFNNTSVSSHRFSWMIFKGEIPEGVEVCHSCDVKSCCNPDHLFLGTHLENIRDAYSKNLIPALKGERNGASKLTEDDVIEIRRSRSEEKTTYKVLADRFSVDQSNIALIVKRKKWKHI